MKSEVINGFQKQVEKLTKKLKQEYCTVRTDTTVSTWQGKRTEKTIFELYIANFGWHRGDTPTEAIAALKEDIRQKEIQAATEKVEKIAAGEDQKYEPGNVVGPGVDS